jgi:hypothetical protein
MFLATSLKMPRICVRLAQDGMGRLERGDLMMKQDGTGGTVTLVLVRAIREIVLFGVTERPRFSPRRRRAFELPDLCRPSTTVG